MQYRNLKREELKELKKLQSIVYFMDYEIEKPSDEPEYDEIRWKFARGAFTDEGKMAAVLEIIPFKSYLDGTIVGSGGIAGVATLLEHRRGGAVKNLLKNAYEEMNDRGDVMSYLYPFSHEYYRKYGYSLGSHADVATIDIKQLLNYRHEGYTKQYFPGDSMDDLKTIYNKFAKQYNFCVARDEWRWKKLFSGGPYTTKQRVFIRYNSDGEPIAYLDMKAKEVADYTYDLVVIEAAWVGYEGIKGLLAIINGYKGDLRKIRLTVPAGFPIEILTKEAWEVEVKRQHTGMNRIINAQKALETIKKPAKAGSVVVGVEDEHAPWNTGNWLIEWEHSISSVSKTKKAADLTCAAPSFSQLVTGHIQLSDLMIKTDVKVNGNMDILEKLFIKKPCFIWDRF